jgi:hypothetical protein
LAWVKPIFLQDIILHFFIFVQMLYDYSKIEEKKLKWKKEIILHEKLVENESFY